MDKKIAALLGAAAAVATVGGAQASTAPVLTSNDALAAHSYADLLTPIPNATQALVTDNAKLSATRAEGVQVAGYYRHHHHHHYRRYHHHHHHGAFIGIPGVGGVTVGSGHHHHPQHHHNYGRD